MVSSVNGAVHSAQMQQLNGAQKAGQHKAAESTKPQESRADTIKQQIESGEYKVDLEMTAKKVAEALL
jgi:anti-sigma28 factor (negative regulator of flagellin synthesis)